MRKKKGKYKKAYHTFTFKRSNLQFSHYTIQTHSLSSHSIKIPLHHPDNPPSLAQSSKHIPRSLLIIKRYFPPMLHLHDHQHRNGRENKPEIKKLNPVNGERKGSVLSLPSLPLHEMKASRQVVMKKRREKEQKFRMFFCESIFGLLIGESTKFV